MQRPTRPGYEQATQQPAPPAYPTPRQTAPPAFEEPVQQAAPSNYGHATASPQAPPSYQPGPPAPHVGDSYPQPGYFDQQHPTPQIVSAPPNASAVPVKAGDSAYSRKAPAIFAAIAAVFGVIIAVVALVVVLANRGDDPASDVPTLAGPAPSDVRMRDYGSSVKLFWADPANGRASFVITGGRPGEQLRPMGQVGPTTTTFDLNGLNADLDYCFAIVAVYSTSQFSTSPQTCTGRAAGTGKPSPGK